MNNPFIKVLTIPSFFFLLVSEFFSQFAMNLLNFILLIVVFSLSSSNTAVAGVVLSFMLPSLLFGIVAGVYVDKWNKKNVLVYTNVLRAFAAFPLIFLSHELFFVYVLSFFVSLITQFFIPAETPIIPLLVPKKYLLWANGLFSMGIFGSIIIAYALSGPLLLILGKTNIFVFITLLFAISSFFAFLIRLKHKVKSNLKLKIDFWAEVKDAFLVMRSKDRIYHSLFLLTLLQTLILMIAVIGPGYATDILKIEVEKFPILFVTPAVLGMAVGSVVIGNFLHKKEKQLIAKFGLLIIGFGILLFPYGSIITSRESIQTINEFLPHLLKITSVHLMVVLASIIGFAFSLVFVPSNTIIQEETTDSQRGKVYGSLNTLIGAFSIIPVLAVGTLADLFGVARVISVIGIILITISLIRLRYKS